LRFPILVRQLAGRRRDLLEKMRQGAVIEPVAGGWPSDRTGDRGCELAELGALERELAAVRRVIDRLKRRTERETLLMMWRARGDFWLASRMLNVSQAEVKNRWQRLVKRAARELKSQSLCAGTACG